MVVLVAIMMIALIGMVSFAVDYSYLLKIRTDMQRSADAAALASVQVLAPAADGSQDISGSKTTLTQYIRNNLGNQSFKVDPDDVSIGRYDPSTIYKSVTLLNDGVFDSVRVTLRRDSRVNGRVPLFFGRIIGARNAALTVSATAILQKARVIRPGAKILPFAVKESDWGNVIPGDYLDIYADGKVKDASGGDVAGNWGTVDIGATGNSTSELSNQIVNGLSQNDLDELYADGRILQDTHIDGTEKIWAEADTGLSSGLKHAVNAVMGEPRLIPLYGNSTDDSGNNFEYEITGWGVVTVTKADFSGTQNTYVRVERSYLYDGDLGADPGGLDDAATIEAAYGAPILVE